LYFAGTAKGWGGSPCFIDTLESPATPTHARAYLITWGQFEDLLAQENARATTAVDLGPDDLIQGSRICLGPGRYENILCFGKLEGFPIVTFTSSWTMAEAELGAPSSIYLERMIAGLRDSHAMSDEALISYLGSAAGCTEELVSLALVST
jgi:hypothetical protein